MSFKSFLNKKSSLIARGINLDYKFWDNFKLMLKNSEEVAELLDIPQNKVVTWHQKIQNALDEYEKEKKINLKSRIIKTGNKIK